MNQPILLCVVGIIVLNFATVALSKSDASTAKSVDSSANSTGSNVSESVKTGPSGSTTQANVNSSAETTSKSSSQSDTTTSKPSPDLEVISLIPTFDFSSSIKEPEPVVVNVCHTKDMCLQGFCIKGTCKTKKCSLDIYCVCDPGFTGQFCDKNITEVELKNGKNGKNGINGKSAGQVETQATSTNKELVNGRIDRKLLSETSNSKNGNFDSGTSGVSKDTAGKSNNDGANQKTSTDSLNGNTRKGDAIRISEKKEKGTGNDVESGIFPNTALHEKTQDVKPKGKSILTEKNKADKNGNNLLPDGSYVKGPEASVSAENGVINLKEKEEAIGIGKPAVVKEQADTVTISTASVEKTRLGIAPEMLAAIKRENFNSNQKAAKAEANNLKQSDISNMKQTFKTAVKNKNDSEGKIVEVKMTSSKRTIQERLHMLSPSETVSPLDEVLLKEIVNKKHVAEGKAAISPLFANSEIKITIEASAVDSIVDKNNGTQNSRTLSGAANSNGLKQKNLSGKHEDKNHITKNNLKSTVNDSVETTPQNSKSKSVLVQSPKKDSSESKGNESQKNIKSEILNPLIQLMNIIGSDKFAENVSAVKIEIITKKNGTDTQSDSSKENNKQKGTNKNKKMKQDKKTDSMISNKDLLPATNEG